MRRIQKAFVLLVLCSCLVSMPSNVFSNWGMEVGRANEGDIARLLQDWIAYKMARNRLDRAMTSSILAERQKVALGISPLAVKSDAELLDDVYEWWLENVMGPARAIASNPAASCAEAETLTLSLLKMSRARQILGFKGTDPRDEALDKMLPETMAMMFNRCRDEALDECIATGRFMQIPYVALAETKQSQLLAGVADANSWADDALKQCAIYELHFVSTTNVAMPIVETVRDGKVTIKFELPGGSIMEAMIGRMKLEEVLKGETKGGNNPFFVSVKCALPGNFEVTCSPGANSDPIKSRIYEMELKHRLFYVDKDGFPKERSEGEDKFAFEFAGGDFALEAVIKSPYSSNKVPLPSVGPAFYIAHRKDSLGKEKGVKIENTKRGAYPVIFEFTYADENTIAGATITDSTEFQLIHKPEKRPFPAKPEPIRKPLKPKPGGGE